MLRQYIIKGLLLLHRFCNLHVRYGTRDRWRKLLHQEALRLLSHHQSDQQWFQLSHSPTTASVSEGLLRVLKAFESKGMTLMFDAVGKDKPKLCTTVCCTPANSSFHSDVCLLGPGLEYLHGISPPGPEPIAVPAKQCITSHKHALLWMTGEDTTTYLLLPEGTYHPQTKQQHPISK